MSTFVKIDERAYKYIRQFTIKTTGDAINELLTNSVDAYRKKGSTSNLIEIEYISPNNLIVRDQAIGLTSEEMVKYFLTVGEYSYIS